MITIMIVDDKQENLYLLESMFSDEYRVVEATNGAEALGLARKSKPDLIITDILMPVMDGFTLCKEWKKDDRLKDVPFVFYTATYTDVRDEKFALSLGADMFILKPQEPDVFMSLIRNILEKIEGKQLETKVPEESSEVNNLREYNEVLIRKLEDKIEDAERARMEQVTYAKKLEREIVERKNIEKSLKASEEQLIHEKHLFQTLALVSPVGIFRTQTDGFTTYVNPKWMELTGLSFDEALGDGWLKAIHPEDRTRVISRWDTAWKAHQVSMAEYRFIRPDGSIIWVSGNAVPESDGDVVTGYVGTIVDVTDRKMFEQELMTAKDRAEASDRLKTAFMNNISHEVRTPLNGILGFGEMIAEPDVTPDEKKRFLSILNSSSERLLKTINDFMDISLIVSNNMEIRPNRFDLHEFMDLLYFEHRPRATAKGLTMVLTKPKEFTSLTVETDHGLFKKVFTHLLDNAIKFSLSGSIEFGYTLKDNQLQFFIKDDGVGIAPDKLKVVFEHFMQEDYLNTRKFEGSGLGLSIAKGIVELLGGSISVTSVKGVGSEFNFSIPALISA